MTDYHGCALDLEPDDYYGLHYDETPNNEPEDEEPVCESCFDATVEVDGDVCDSCNDRAAEKIAAGRFNA